MGNENYASYVDFYRAIRGEYIHTMDSCIDCISDEHVVDIVWLMPINKHDEIISVVYSLFDEDDDEERDFNIIVPKELFDKKRLVEWMKENPDKVNKDDTEIRGVTFDN